MFTIFERLRRYAMTITNSQSGTNVHEVSDGIYRINTPVVFEGGGGFSFNQYLIVDDEPLLFHTGPRKMFPLVREAVASVLPVERLRYIGFSHVEADECGSLNEWLAVAPQSAPLCGKVAGMVSIDDLADRSPRTLANDEVISLGKRSVRWFDTPHLPHAWECGFLTEESTRTLLCGDLFTAICLPRAAMSFHRLLNQTYSAQVKRFDIKWITSHTRKTRARCLSVWPQLSQQPLPACTAVHGAAMVRSCYERLQMSCHLEITIKQTE